MADVCFYCGKETTTGVICGSPECVVKYHTDDIQVEAEHRGRLVTSSIECHCCGRRFRARSQYVRFCNKCRAGIIKTDSGSILGQDQTSTYKRKEARIPYGL